MPRILANSWPKPTSNFILAATSIPSGRFRRAPAAPARLRHRVLKVGFNGRVNLSVSNGPSGVTAAFSPNTANSEYHRRH